MDFQAKLIIKPEHSKFASEIMRKEFGAQPILKTASNIYEIELDSVSNSSLGELIDNIEQKLEDENISFSWADAE